MHDARSQGGMPDHQRVREGHGGHAGYGLGNNAVKMLQDAHLYTGGGVRSDGGPALTPEIDNRPLCPTGHGSRIIYLLSLVRNLSGRRCSASRPMRDGDTMAERDHR